VKRFSHFLVFPTQAAAQAHADILTAQRITDEHRANGTTAYTAPVETDDGKWFLQVEDDVETPPGATRASSVARKQAAEVE
jgi:hypothetical protein